MRAPPVIVHPLTLGRALGFRRKVFLTPREENRLFKLGVVNFTAAPPSAA